jgi:RhoGEF domain
LHARANSKPVLKDKDDPLLKKQIEILTEIIDSEFKYLEDLKLIQVGFMDPVQQSGFLTEAETKDVFYNIRELISVHEIVWGEISVSYGTFKQKLLTLIDSFMSAVKVI